ncbi:MAG: hypothetical protein ACXV5Q_02295 [Frankiaceae bacterium]
MRPAEAAGEIGRRTAALRLRSAATRPAFTTGVEGEHPAITLHAADVT